jgi:predicted nucleotidyltransferase
MLTRQDILNFLQDNKDYLKKHFHLTKVGIFGSFARNEQKLDSDIDLLIERAPDAKNIFDSDWELKELLKKQFNREVDICTEKYIKPYAKQYILRDAIYV